MIKKFRDYYKESEQASRKMYDLKNIAKYYLINIICILLELTIILIPVARVWKMRYLHSVKDDEVASTILSVKAIDDPKAYYNCAVGGSIIELIFVGLIIGLAVIGGVLSLIGFGIGYFVGNVEFIPILFAAIPALFIVLLILFMPIAHIPSSFIVESAPNMTPSKVVYVSFEALKKKGKLIVFLSYLLELLFKALILGSGVLVCFLLTFIEDYYTSNGLMFIFIAIFTIIYLYFAPSITIRFSICRYLLYEELTLDTINPYNKVIDIKYDNKKNVRKKPNLVRLFDDDEYGELSQIKVSKSSIGKVVEENTSKMYNSDIDDHNKEKMQDEFSSNINMSGFNEWEG